eukprot:TRINITY_DN6602_c0_g1_i1.p1 TRINITY_DN6602_c0_g1~~TRINITY_DN6602_c0_g1_i1.p1  ORF type:complete len:379 (-),score=123.41 TRINITY_DN6602_c0_g1_i1:329-1465(-)
MAAPRQEVFETPEPEVDFERENEKYTSLQQATQTTSVNENNVIEVTNIVAGKSYAEFAKVDKELTAKSSGREVKVVETPAEKFRRLQLELNELREEVAFLQEQEKQFAIARKNPGGVGLEQLEALEREIQAFASDKEIGSILNSVTKDDFSLANNLLLLKPDAQKRLTESLLRRLKVLATPNGDAKEGGNATVELYVGRDTEKVKELLRFEALEARLATLEKVIGTQDTAKEDLQTRVSKLGRVMSYVDQARVDEVGARAATVLADIDNLVARRAELQVGEAEFKRVDELYELFGKTARIVEELPTMAERLETLRYLHEESASFAVRLKELEETQRGIAAILGENKTLLGQLEGAFATNVSKFEASVAHLDERLAKLV